MLFEVKCINNDKSPKGSLTVGKTYKVFKELERTYIVVDNYNNRHSAFKTRFEKI